MADEPLTQAELETLLNSLDAPQAFKHAQEALQPTLGARTAPVTKARDKVSAYDFKRPERIDKDQLRALQTLHESFARNFSAALSAMLRSSVHVELTSVDQLSYGEFSFSLENPTCFNVLKAAPLNGRLALDFNLSILYPMIDRLLGGGREPAPMARRPLTDIEQRLVARVTQLFLQELRKAWSDVVNLDLSVLRVESNPQHLQIVPPNEVVVLISFELALGENWGMINLCIPFHALEGISDRLSSNRWTPETRRVPSGQSIAAVGRQLSQAVVELEVRLAETKIATGDLLNLRVGDIITTEKDVHGPMSVCVEGIEKFRASPGTFKGRKAVQIDQTLDPPRS